MAQADDQKCFIGMLLAFISFLVYSEVAPYKHPLNNGIVKVAQCVIFSTFGSALAIENGISRSLNATFFGCLLLASNLLLILLAGGLAVQSYRRGRWRWAPLSEGMEHHFFLSHYQFNSGDQCDMLDRELRSRGFNVWYDNKADDLTEKGTKAGVEKSEVFVLFLNSYTLSRWFVQLEVKEAVKLQKSIVLIRETDGRHDAPVDDDGCFDLEMCFEHNPTDVQKYRSSLDEALTEEQTEEDIKKKFPPVPDEIRETIESLQGSIVPYMRRSPFREATIATILDEANLTHLAKEPEDAAELIPPLPPMPNSFKDGGVCVIHHAAIACSELGNDQSDKLIALLSARWGVVASKSGTHESAVAGVAQSCCLIVLLTDHVMQDAGVQAQIREAKTLGLPILLVYETEKRYGAPLSEDKTFDFARVFGEQAPSDLNTLHHGIEGIAYQRSAEGGPSDRFVEAMLDAIVKRAGAALRGRMVREASATTRRSPNSVSFSGSLASEDIRMQEIGQSSTADGGDIESAGAEEEKETAALDGDIRSPLLPPASREDE